MSIEIIGMGHHAVQVRRQDIPVPVNVNRAAESDDIQAETEQKVIYPNEISKAVEQIQRLGDMFDRKLQFQVNKDINQIVIKVIDANTDKVIREIPSVEIQRLQARIRETVGLLFDETI